MKKVISILVITLLYSLFSFAVDREFKNLLPSFKPTVIERKLMDVNSISAWYRNDGEFFSDHSTQGPGFEWPKGGGVYAIFSSSMWIGAKVRDTAATDTNKKDIRVATVGHFGSELRPGIILEDGTPDDYTKSKYRYYKVRPNEDSPINPDWLEWPVDVGAPYHDIDGDGTYNPYVDKPALIWGDQVVYPDMLMFAVYNDADPAYHSWIWGRSLPLGAEVRQLSWAYNRSGPFGQMIFMRFEVINKSSNVWDSTYLVVWSDPDLGDAFDDYCGVDTTIFDSTVTSRGVIYEKRNLGFCYNGDNNDGPPGYGSAPPSVGYKYFQGPRIFTGNIEDTAKWSGLRIPGYINLNQSGFNFYCNPGQGGCTNPDWYDPSLYEQSYNIMKGRTRTDKPWIDPHTGDTVSFVFAGDPVTGVGFLNKDYVAPSDIRFTMPAGPFRMMPGDTQQVVVGVIVARGSSELNSITVLRNYADLSQTLFNNNFRLPPPPPMPKLEYSFVNGNLLLTWDKRAEDFVNFDPKFDSTTWKFHAYDLYQTNDPLLRPGAKIEKIANWYIKGGRNKVYDWVSVPNVDEPVKMKIWEGGTEGIVNNILLTEDRISLKPFIPGKPYYFILTATAIAEYEDTDTSKLKTISGLLVLESPKIPITIVPKNPVQGSEFPSGANYGDLVSHNRWVSKNHFDDALQIYVIDPWRTENAKYKITFDGVDTNVTAWKLWRVINSTTDSLVYESNNFSGDDNYPVVSNVMPKVVKLPVGVRRATQNPRGWSYKGRRWFNGAYNSTMDEFGTTTRYGLVAYPRSDNFEYKESGLRADSLRRVEIRFSTKNTQKAYRYIAGFAPFPPIKRRVVHPEFRPFVKDSTGSGFLYQDYEQYRLGVPDSGYVVPFTVWEVDTIHGTERQLDVAIIERNDTLYKDVKIMRPDSTLVDTTIFVNYGKVDGRWYPTEFYYPNPVLPTTPLASKQGDEVILIFGTTYTDTPKTIYTGGTTETYKPHFNILDKFDKVPVMYAVWMKRLRPDTTFREGDIFYIRPNYQLNANNVFEFEVKAPILGNPDLARMRNEMNKIKVVPNPYYASHQLQQDAFDSYVTFTNLPAKCKIRIFNLAGDMIRTIEHDNMGIIDNSSTRWDLKNHAGIPVASGMYIAHIEAEGIGEKVVKFAIFIQEERLDTF